MDYFNQQSERLKFRKLTTEDIPKWIPFFQNNDRLIEKNEFEIAYSLIPKFWGKGYETELARIIHRY